MSAGGRPAVVGVEVIDVRERVSVSKSAALRWRKEGRGVSMTMDPTLLECRDMAGSDWESPRCHAM